MNTVFNTLIKKLLPFVFLVLFAYLVSSVLFFFLPKSGVDFIKNDELNIKYKRYSGFYSDVKVVKKEIKKRKKVELVSLTKYKLKAIYSTSDNCGWITIEDNNGKKSHILSQGESIDGYVLEKLFKRYVLFKRDSKEYKLELVSKSNENILYEITPKKKQIKEKIVVENSITKVNRNYLNSYVTNIEKVWDNISIKELRNGRKIDGFKVTGVKKGSAFDKLGLKKGDIIKTVNNEALNSYADAFKVYNNINKTQYLSIEVLRNNEIMELNYEID